MQDWINTIPIAYLYGAAWLVTYLVGFLAHKYVFSNEAQLAAHFRERERHARRHRQSMREIEDAAEAEWQARLAAASKEFHATANRKEAPNA